MTTTTHEAWAAEPAIPEKEWSRILERIEGGKVIPVIGEHLTLMSGGDPPVETSLASYLAEQLDLPGPPTCSLNEVALRYLRQNPRGLDDLYADIFQILPTAEAFPLPQPLKQLAEIRDFNLFVSTSFDPYMALALNEVRFGRRCSGSTRVLAYEGNRAVDIPERYTELDYPLVYHLFGKAEASPVFAVTDEDVLELVHTLQSPECQPPHLSEALRAQRLLVLGTRLTGWLTRFFLRISSSNRLRDARRADYLIDPTANTDADQTLFFEQFGEVKLLPMSPAHFVEELGRRWRAVHPNVAASGSVPRKTPVPVGAGDVFLSYASEDLAVAKGLRERLEREAGVRVWLDKESLRGGDQWGPHIADALRSCAVCVPVVSASTKSAGSRYVRTEWREAVQLNAGRRADQAFIIPLVIDDTRADDPALAPEIRALHWRRLRDEEDMRRFVAEVRAAVEKALST
jgi:hypothetical protein